jgi:hypothetical protein
VLQLISNWGSPRWNSGLYTSTKVTVMSDEWHVGTIT